MNILIIGSGGREHALAWKISQSDLCNQLYIAPGNGGTLLCGINVQIDIRDFEQVKQCCIEHNIQLVVVGPEDPLVQGIYDFFKQTDALKSVMIIAPSKQAAQLEGSKGFAKAFMKRHHIPTASFAEFNKDNYDQGIAYIKQHSLPVVLKADGLAAGKGVVICNNTSSALKEFEEMIINSKFGNAGNTVVIEEFLNGIELSVFVLTDGKDYLILPEAKDYKTIGEGNTGLNTGGMGAVSPVPFAGAGFMNAVEEKIIKPTIKGLQEEKMAYNGIIFLGLINVNAHPLVIEYNCRFGDPETEVVMVRLQNDLVDLFVATANGGLNDKKIEVDPRSSATIVAVSGGYPGSFRKNIPIELGYLDNSETTKHIGKGGGTEVFHSGTIMSDGILRTNGGRVFAVSSLADSIGEAVEASLEVLSKIYFHNMYYRTDIGKEFLD